MASTLSTANQDLIISQALRILEERVKYAVWGDDGAAVQCGSPDVVKTFLTLRLGACEREEFHVVWLDAKNTVISIEKLFVGTLTQSSVYPREVVKAGLAANAAACILCHNHPSGNCAESQADINLTVQLKKALALVDILVLDHIIVAGTKTFSFAEKGLI